ncbi:MAG: hypothetical protein ACPGSO_00355 [Vicingaceae bacterium]
MRKLFTYQFIAASILCLCMLQAKVSNAQWTADVAGLVKKEETKKRMEGATITIKRNGSVWKTIPVDAKGKFNVPLLPGAVYMIEVSKPMHVTKRIQVSTKNVPPEDAKYGFDIPFDISLFEKMEGLDVSILDKPIGKIAFDPNSGYMDYDAAYTKSIKDKLDQLKRELAARLKAEKENREKNQKVYDAAIAAADKAFNAGKFEEAKPFYEKAAKIFPTETYPEFQLGDISDKLRERAEAEKRYKSTIVKADAAFKARDWEKATSAYEHAAYLKENEQYPKDKIKAIKAEIDKEKKAAKEYNDAIAAADLALSAKEYEKAKTSYQKAAELKDYEQYPKDKLKEIDGVLAEIAKKKAAEKALNEKYKGLIAAADNLLQTKKYEVAKAKYQEANTVKPEEQYPQTKITEIDGVLAALAKKEAEYKALITTADNLLGAKDYAGAKAKYKEALGIKPAEQFPKDQIKTIDGILAEIAKKEAEEKAKEAKYQGLIAAADNLLGSKNYEGAKAKYNEALSIKSGEQYPKEKITEIDGILAEIAKKKAEEKAKQAKYDGLIATADKMLSTKNYTGAKGKYNEALGVKPNEQYPKTKLTEIDEILAEIARKEAEKKAKEEEYKALIVAADGLFSGKNYADAKGKYKAAIAIKAEEKYPKDKIVEIDVILAEIAKKEAEEKAKEAKYQGLIIAADNMLGSKDYNGAKAKYNEALGVKAGEEYPKSKLKEIEGILAEIARKKAEAEAAKMAAGERDAKYEKTITAANTAFESKKYETAKSKFNEALGIKSGEQYPKDKLVEIEAILAEIAKKKAAEDAANMAANQKEENYNKAIKLGDNAFSAKSYQTAIGKYNEALNIKPNEQYPKDRLAEIEVALAEQAKQSEEDALAAESERKKREYFNALIAEADGELAGQKYDAAKSKYSQALMVIPDEQYPKDKLKEIAKILADLKANEKNAALAKQQLEENYKKLIAQADGSFSGKNYKGARVKYQEALNLKSSEAYPRNQIAEIDRILGEIAAKESEITLKNNAQKQKEQAYANFIKNGDEQLAAKQYRIALSNYKQAIEVKGTEQYPKDKVKEINKILADIEAKERANNANALAQQAKRKEYDKVIFDADRAFKLKDYTRAKSKYNMALAIIPTEQYPKDRLSEIEARLNEKPKEEIIVKKTNPGERATIDDENEREIEKRIAMLLAGSNEAKEKQLEKEKADYNHQQIIRITAGIERTVNADKELDKYTEQERQFIKKQEELNIDKAEAHYAYVDNLEESNIIMYERSEDERADNRKDIEKIAADAEKSKRRSRKKRKEKEIDVLELKSNVAKQEEIRLRASKGRIAQNQDEIRLLAEEMAIMKAEGIDSYKGNVVELAAFKEELISTESSRLKRAEEERQTNKKDRDRVYDEARKNVRKQDEKYYKDAELVEEYKKEVAKREVVNKKDADEKRIQSNKELLAAKDKLGATTPEQEKRYEEFHAKLKEEQELNNTFLSDLKTIERNKILEANANLNNVYRGEKQETVNEELASKYSQGITEETIESGNSIIIRRTKVTGNHVDVYERIFYKWGGSYFMKNGKSITKTLWDKESIE